MEGKMSLHYQKSSIQVVPTKKDYKEMQRYLKTITKVIGRDIVEAVIVDNRRSWENKHGMRTVKYESSVERKMMLCEEARKVEQWLKYYKHLG